MKTVIAFVFVILCIVFFQTASGEATIVHGPWSIDLLQPDTSHPLLSSLHTNDLAVTLGYFDEKQVPHQMADGCSGRYAFDTLTLHTQKMILFINTDTAIMRINYRLVFLKINHSEIHGKETVSDFSGQGYTIKFTSKEIKKADTGSFIRSGIIEISRNGQRKIFYVMGKYGC